MQKYKDFWNESFDRLDRALAEYMAVSTGSTTGNGSSAENNPTTEQEKEEK